MNASQVEQRATELFENGLHCAEAVLQALHEAHGLPEGVSPRAATAFGGGVARSKKGLCGALSGGLIALGLLQGRDAGGQPWGDVAARGGAALAWFAGEYGCTRCGVVLEKLGPQEGDALCARLTGRTAARFHELLAGEAPAVTGCGGCGCSA